ncbi:MAG: transcription antitermination factor NusB, partial [Candidatus Omnitrophica bacterium]|nr:transcription antitermination factor NusB [Candidatus Omnitrophota bacterium]
LLRLKFMRKRTLAREFVLKVLYQADIRSEPLCAMADEFFSLSISETQDEEVTSEVIDFARHIITGIAEKYKEINDMIFAHAANWHIDRMAVIDRNILRMGIYELCFMPDVPAKVTINEAIELAKKYGDVESGKFVNGILDKVHKTNPLVQKSK